MSTFANVRRAFVGSLDANLAMLGVKCVGSATGEWRQVVCPLCDDQGGSCDIATASGHLKCKQCQRSDELFAWVGSLSGKTNTWETCQHLAAMVGVEVEIPKRRGRPPRAMTEDLLKQATHQLWTAESAEPCREFLRRRKIADPEILESLDVGFLAGYIVIAQRWPGGQLKDRYRRYSPGAPAGKIWSWSPGSGNTQGLYPVFKPPHEAQIILLEGEFDLWTAWARLYWHRQKIFAYTWTGGVKAIPPGEMPDWIENRVVDICYDNDVFQGPDWNEHKAPNTTRLAEMLGRREKMLETARGLELRGCKVRIRAIPVSPADKWGGDFRDWVDAGGRDWNEVPKWTLAQVKKASEVKPIETDFNGVYQLAGKKASFEAVVQSLEEEGITIPKRSCIDCPMGSESYCQQCRVPEKFPGQVIDWSLYPNQLVAALLSRDPERVIQKDVLGKPGRCPYCRILPLDYKVGSIWIAVQDDRDDISDRELTVISEQSPTLSGRITVHGSVQHHRKNVIVHADKLEMRETQEIDLKLFAGKIHEICPVWQSNDVLRIDAAIRERAADMARHVTHIFGRPELHIAADLLSHSALWLEVDGHRKRGWLDIAVTGSTSSGKSMTFKHIIEHHGLGRMHTCMENVSRAGLTMGAIQGNGRMRLKPGLFPRSHRGMLILDEFHIMVEEKKDHPMLHLQSARDEGHVGGIKIYGARQLPAAVRLATISNWVDGRRDAFKFPCEHFLALYGKPEALRRLDFGLVVDGEPTNSESDVPHTWTKDLVQATVLRAWSQNPDQIRVSPDALEQARNQVRDWGRFYAEELPLFTGAEKLFSLLRIAVAAANILFSHPKDCLRTCEVRKGHVEWAAQWLEQCWADSMYDQFSSSQFAKREVRQPFHVEANLTVQLQINTADEALRLLDNLFGVMSMAEMSAYVGKETYQTLAWASGLVRLGALERVTAKNNYNTMWRLTSGAHALLKNLLDLADEFPQEFHDRTDELQSWVSMRAMRGDPNLQPLETVLQEKRDGWGDPDGQTNIVGGPGSA